MVEVELSEVELGDVVVEVELLEVELDHVVVELQWLAMCRLSFYSRPFSSINIHIW